MIEDKQSRTEKLLLAEMYNLGLRPKSQYKISKHTVDFAFPEADLVVEVDGPHHRTQEQKEKDKKREDIEEVYGWKIMRFNAEDVYKEPKYFANEIKDYIDGVKRKNKEESKEELDEIFEKYNKNDVKKDTVEVYSTHKKDWEEKPLIEYEKTKNDVKRDTTKDIVISLVIFIIIFMIIVEGTNEGWSSILKSEAMRVYGLMFFFLLIGFLVYIKIKK